MKAALLLCLLFSSLCARSQYQAEKFSAALLEAKYGALLVYNGQKNSFTLKFVSKSFKPTKQPNFVEMDGFIIQTSIIPFKRQADFASPSEEDQKKYLESWKNYEKSWLEDQLKKQLHDKVDFVKINERLFLRWLTDMPDGQGNGSVVKQTYLVTICFDQLMVLNAPVVKDQDDQVVTGKLSEIAKTLELKPNAVQDLKKLYTELKN